MDCIQRFDAVRSKAGHDSGRLYLVTDLRGGRAVLCDGKIRKLARPKVKNLKHIELVRKAALRPDAQETTDRYLRKLLAAVSRETN